MEQNSYCRAFISGRLKKMWPVSTWQKSLIWQQHKQTVMTSCRVKSFLWKQQYWSSCKIPRSGKQIKSLHENENTRRWERKKKKRTATRLRLRLNFLSSTFVTVYRLQHILLIIFFGKRGLVLSSFKLNFRITFRFHYHFFLTDFSKDFYPILIISV